LNELTDKMGIPYKNQYIVEKDTFYSPTHSTTMSRATQSFKTGMSFIGGAKVPAYSLEYLDDSPEHPAGSYETIVVPYIEIGRSGKCAVRFSENWGTVSRYHAALLRRGQEIFVKNISTSNPTLLNGEPIKNEEVPLGNGDELQLSYEGPRIRFNVTQAQQQPASGAAAAPSVGITKRIGMVVNQAVRPYRTAVLSLLLLILLGGVVAAYFIYQLNQETDVLAGETQELKGQNASLADSLAVAVRANQELRDKLMADRQNMELQLQATVSEFKAKQQNLVQEIKSVDPEELVADAIASVKSSVFYMGIKNVRAEMDGELLIDEPFPENCHCTGFLLTDGRFLTARHCIELYLYETNELNLVASVGGKVTYDFYAISSDEKQRFDFTNHDFTVNGATDYYEEDEYNGQEVMLRKASIYDGTDWAFVQTDAKGAIQADPEMSVSLKSGTELHCLGYTYGNAFQKFNTQEGLEVLYSKASVAKDKLDNNTIVVSGYGFDNGNSGGPLFVIRNGVAKAVAIVSAGYMNPSTGRDDALGSVVPLKNVSN
jgi:pSer/pThr/pTyr-binding forkhead associated (FHA) protein/V8-like Glu-specific endopeptidase